MVVGERGVWGLFITDQDPGRYPFNGFLLPVGPHLLNVQQSFKRVPLAWDQVLKRELVDDILFLNHNTHLGSSGYFFQATGMTLPMWRLQELGTNFYGMINKSQTILAKQCSHGLKLILLLLFFVFCF